MHSCHDFFSLINPRTIPQLAKGCPNIPIPREYDLVKCARHDSAYDLNAQRRKDKHCTSIRSASVVAYIAINPFNPYHAICQFVIAGAYKSATSSPRRLNRSRKRYRVRTSLQKIEKDDTRSASSTIYQRLRTTQNSWRRLWDF